MTQITSEIGALFQEATRIASDYLEGLDDRDQPVVRVLPPQELRKLLDLSLPREGRPVETLTEDMRRVLHHSVRTGHPRFFNQLFGGFDPAAILGEWIVALTNTSMYTYEAAPVATLMEMELIEKMCSMVGFDEGEGVFAPGGSISNLMAVLTARHFAFPHVKQHGLRPADRPVMFISREAHYSLQRAAAVAGIGLDAVIEIDTDEVGRMDTAALERAVDEAVGKGQQPFLVAATAGTTVPGAFDPIDAIADVAQSHGLWLHVDGSYGGSVIFSPRHRHLLAGIERADSVAWNPHKMMGVPLACSATLMREKGRLVATNGMNADYLFHGDAEESIDLGDMTLQCGRRVDALKLWFSWQALGDEGFVRRIDDLFDLARGFCELIDGRPGYHLVREPQGTNVCFRYLPPADRDTQGEERDQRAHEATLRIRERLVRDGRFLVNYATLDGLATFRLVLNNSRTTLDDLSALLEAIEE